MLLLEVKDTVYHAVSYRPEVFASLYLTKGLHRGYTKMYLSSITMNNPLSGKYADLLYI